MKHLDQYDEPWAYEAGATTVKTTGSRESRVPRTSPWREILRRRREERSRVLPLPLAFAAISFPFLCAWAVGGQGASAGRSTSSSAALDALDREHRTQAAGEAYVDVHGAVTGWERGVLARQGYVPPR